MNLVKRCSEWFHKECSLCDGSGITTCHCDEYDQIVCPECMGKGVIDECVLVTNTIEVPCDNPACQHGRVPCPHCQGTGKQSNGQVCGHCQGKATVECGLCKGLGRIERQHQEQWVKHRQCPTCGGKGKVNCPYCHGTKNRVCPLCHGKGEVINKGRVFAAGVLLILMASMPMISITILGFALAGLCLYLACQYFPPESESEEVQESVDPNEDQK